MDAEVLVATNQELAEKIKSLSAQVAKQEKMLGLCLQVISEFGHFIPSIIENFKDEMENLDGDELGER